ncbi:MAG: type II toxin-antitoxin system RelE/ParE family toxin [Polyangiales bacterium]
MIEVVVTGLFEDWYGAPEEEDQDAVARVVGLLEARGVTLPFPHSSAIAGSRSALRELRVQSQGKPLRVLYAFDPERQAVLLVGGDKTGDDRWYERTIPIAEREWDSYLEEIRRKS